MILAIAEVYQAFQILPKIPDIDLLSFGIPDLKTPVHVVFYLGGFSMIIALFTFMSAFTKCRGCELWSSILILPVGAVSLYFGYQKINLANYLLLIILTPFGMPPGFDIKGLASDLKITGVIIFVQGLVLVTTLIASIKYFGAYVSTRQNGESKVPYA